MTYPVTVVVATEPMTTVVLVAEQRAAGGEGLSTVATKYELYEVASWSLTK